MGGLILGLVGSSSKPDERRVPIHPRHFERIAPGLRERMVVERGYGLRFGVPDEELEAQVGALATRAEVIAGSDVVVLPKPVLADVESLRDGQVLWGWPHLVQDARLTQVAIDKRLTLIAWEAMNHWVSDGSFGVHVFHMNNEMAGYCSVLHALTLTGRTGHYGRHLSAVVIGFGNTARGAVAALQALGVADVAVLTQREVSAVASPMPGTTLHHMERIGSDPGRTLLRDEDGAAQPTLALLATRDIIVNCVFQDTDAPLMFATTDDLHLLAPGTLIVDVSCDTGMGFDFAQPTSFRAPLVEPSPGVHYYGVDHSPSYLYDSATWMISEALIPHLAAVMAGREAWHASDTIRLAIEIEDGVVHNRRILSFQGRSDIPPHVIHVEHG